MPLCEPWAAEYAGADANGPHVVALWSFDATEKTDEGRTRVKDVSGHGHDGVLEQAEITADGRFGQGLESFRGWPVEDERHRMRVENHADLSPKGAFSIEMWICPKPELNADYPSAILLDKKYVDHHDYQLVLGQADRAGSRTLHIHLGFGADSSTWYAEPMEFEPGQWHHLAFTYDGAGTGRFFIDGVPRGAETIGSRRAISPGNRPLYVGDRVGSLYHGFPGVIDQVRISRGALEYRRLAIERASDRTSFVRMEPAVALRFRLRNLQRKPIAQGKGKLVLPPSAPVEIELAGLGPGATKELNYPLDTRLRPGEYEIRAEVAVSQPDSYTTADGFVVDIVPRRPSEFPVVMWGGATDDFDRIERIGFTHVLGVPSDTNKVFEAGTPTLAAREDRVADAKQMLNEALRRGIGVIAGLSPGAHMRRVEQFQRVDREGKPYERADICGLFPELPKLCYNVGASVAQTFGHFPAFDAAMIHTEVRGHAIPCFHEHDREAFRKATGLEIPEQVVRHRGVDYKRLPDFPENRVIPDDHPIYVYLKWFWKEGDGWNRLNTELVRGLKSTGRKDLWTYHDPAVRVASVYGSGGQVDFLSQWTYSYPDPIRIGVATDELFAMAAGAATPQQVMKMTQIIWYRGQTAPEPNPGEAPLTYQADWERQQPEAPFITIAPMHLREAFWTKIARPIRGIMYHGWQSLVPCEPLRSYRYTNPETQHELSRIIRQVVRPLGPTLLAVPGVKSDVAYFESFASQMFARRGTYGWCGGWAGDGYHVMMYAHLQPEIVYDEAIAQRGLDGYKLLVMFDCDVLTQSVVDRVNAWQKAGGLIVGDENLCPAIKADITLPRYDRTGRADEDKQALLTRAAELRKALDSRYSRLVDTSNPNVIPYRRAWESADYVFLVNDHREYGRYVGHHGLVMENGLPSEATVSLRRSGGVVYDLTDSREVSSRQDGDRLKTNVQLSPCDGRLLLVAPQAISGVRVEGPASVARGSSAELKVRIVDAQGEPVAAVVPVEVTVTDASSRRAEFSGYHAAEGGVLTLRLDIAPNDPFGVWTVAVRELASNKASRHFLRVEGPKPWPPEPKSATEEQKNPEQPLG